MGVWPSYVFLWRHLIGAKIKRGEEKQPLQDAVWVLPNYNDGLKSKLEVFRKMKTNCMPWFRHFCIVYLFVVFFNTFSKAFQLPVNFAVFSKLSLLVITLSQQVSLALGAEVYLLYVERSISSGSSPTFTSKRSCTSFSILASFSSETKVMARPFVPKRPALATWCKLETTWS